MHLKPGDIAPTFSLRDQTGKIHSLENYKGQYLALYFYPKDLTPGCTLQACNIRNNYESLQKANIAVLGVSADDENRHQRFIDKYQLPFPLLADVEKKMIQDYGVWGPKQFMGKKFDGIHRITFIINKEGMIHSIINKVKTTNHVAQILEAIDLERK